MIYSFDLSGCLVVNKVVMDEPGAVGEVQLVPDQLEEIHKSSGHLRLTNTEKQDKN